MLRGILNIALKKIVTAIRRIKIFSRLIISFLLVIIIPNIIIGSTAFSKSSKELDAVISNSLYQYIGTINISIADTLSKYEKISRDLSQNPELIGLLKKCEGLAHIKNQSEQFEQEYYSYKKRINSILYQLNQPLDLIVNIEILSNYDEFTQINNFGSFKGGVLKYPEEYRKSGAYNDALDAKGYPIWLDTNREDNIYLKQINLKSYLSEYVTLLRNIPVNNGQGSYGIIIMNVSVNVFSGLYQKQPYINDGNLILVGSAAPISSLNQNVKGPFLDTDTNGKILQMKSGTLIQDINGTGCLVVFRDLQPVGWETAALIPRYTILTSVYQVRDIIVRMCVLCILAAVILSYLVTVSISNPVRTLKKAMESVNSKYPDIKYTDVQSDEIGALGEKFNSMIGDIKNLIHTIYETELIKKGEELKRKEAELDALQMQINPHFLYNTLDIIRWEVAMEENGDGKGSQMIKAFADLLRYATKVNANLVTIEEEFNHVKAYLKVMEFKHERKITVVWEVQENLLECKITKLTLQPLVENSIVHGFTGSDKSTIFIRAYEAEGKDVIVEVADNGMGIPDQKLEGLNNEIISGRYDKTGVGLRNVNGRIKLCFGQEYGLSLYSAEGKGTI